MRSRDPQASRSANVIQLANTHVSFSAAARWCGLEFYEVRENGTKTHCPFEEFAHPDGGLEPAFRVYPDHGYCFACSKRFTAVSLWAEVHGLLEQDAAVQLLERSEYRPASYAHLWARAAKPPEPDRQALAEALKTWVGHAIPDWETRQYEPGLSSCLGKALGLLPLVTTEQECSQWLAAGKKALARIAQGGDAHDPEAGRSHPGGVDAA